MFMSFGTSTLRRMKAKMKTKDLVFNLLLSVFVGSVVEPLLSLLVVELTNPLGLFSSLSWLCYFAILFTDYGYLLFFRGDMIYFSRIYSWKTGL